MRRYSFLLSVLMLSGLWLVSTGEAQGQTEQPGTAKSFVDKLNDFGRKLIGSPTEQEQTRSGARSIRQGQSGAGDRPSGASGNERSSGDSSQTRIPRDPGARSTADSMATRRTPITRDMPPPPDGAAVTERLDSGVARGSARESMTDERPMPMGGSIFPPEADSGRNSPTVGRSPTASVGVSRSNTDSPELRPLHERMAGFRESVFGPVQSSGVADAASSAGPSEPPVPSVATTPQPSAASLPSPVTASPASPSWPSNSIVDRTTPRYPPSDRIVLRREEPKSVLASPTGGRPTLAPPQAHEPLPVLPRLPELAPATVKSDEPAVTKPKDGEAQALDAKVAGESAEKEDRTTARDAARSKPPERSQPGLAVSEGAERPSSERAAGGNAADNVLFTRQSPMLGAETIGPKRIMVGKESNYEVIVYNSGQVGADQVVVTVALPEWTEVAGSEPSVGSVSSGPPDSSRRQAGAEPLLWKVGRLESRGREKLVLRIVPRQSKPFDLGVKWDYAPVASRTMIEVQEPKLEVQLHGPRDVLFGKAEIYRLELSNPGTGDAENVVISLLPEGTGENVPVTHRLGTLAAGDKKTIEVELTARQAGNLTIKVDARAEGGLLAQLAEKILVQRAALTVAVEAPAVQYVGSEATYRILVKNPGTAPAGKVEVMAAIPAGSRFVSCTHNGRPTSSQRKIVWSLDNLAPGGEMALGLTCNLVTAGSSRLQISSTADGDLMAQAYADVQVEAIADLALSMKDPSGPVAVGAEAVYELRIQNRGTRAAEGVDVATYFSEGLEPAAAEGSPNQLTRGQVVFNTIPSVAAGECVVLKVKARAERAGNHIVRAEVLCRPLGTRLVSEETTHFYDSGRGAPSIPLAQPARTTSPSPASPLRTADRREPAAVTSPSSRSVSMPVREDATSGGTLNAPKVPWRTTP